MDTVAGNNCSGGSSKKRPVQSTSSSIDSDKNDNNTKKYRAERVRSDNKDTTTTTTTTNHSKIWLNNKLVVRPNYVTSYGILFYRESGARTHPKESKPTQDSSKDDGHNNVNNNSTDVRAKQKETQFEYLLGLIPQGNSWTVFKGLPETNERPEDTAVREFEEESSLPFPYPYPNPREDWGKSDSCCCPVTAVLHGVTSTKKLLEIFLIPAPPGLDVSQFDVDKVVKIDGSGRFSGLPEIVEIRFLTKTRAVEGIRGKGKHKIAKIYKSQVSILERADRILKNNERE
eukprot:jgi/Psemu1/282803/fgenesh1_pg.14_\